MSFKESRKPAYHLCHISFPFEYNLSSNSLCVITFKHVHTYINPNRMKTSAAIFFYLFIALSNTQQHYVFELQNSYEFIIHLGMLCRVKLT